jgi:hypothetical protein
MNGQIKARKIAPYGYSKSTKFGIVSKSLKAKLTCPFVSILDVFKKNSENAKNSKNIKKKKKYEY